MNVPFKFDAEMMRDIVLYLESIPMRLGGAVSVTSENLEEKFPEKNLALLYYHMQLVQECGYLRKISSSNPMNGIIYAGLSMDGVNFVNSVRDPDVWKKTKSGAVAAGGFTLDLIKDLAVGFCKKQIEEKTGVKL